MTEVIMPKMGDAMEEGILVEWLKSDGDRVSADEPIANIQTDKAVVELTAPAAGKLAGILVKPDEAVAVGKPIAAILADGEKLPQGWGDGVAAEARPAEKPEIPLAGPKAGPEKKPEIERPADGDRVKASPLARKVAESLGVDVSRVRGTGPGGRVVERDVRAYKESAPSETDGGRVRPLSRLRQLIAERTQAIKREAPHFYVTVEVDMEAVEELRARMNEANPDERISVNDFVMKACARALLDLPDVNSNIIAGEWLLYDRVHMGMAVATERGLLAPVIRDCDRKTLRRISREAKDLAKRTRDAKVEMEELQGSTFTVSNMGMLNVENFIAILNAPNVALVAVGTSRRVPVVAEDGSIQVRSRMNITGSFDHRAVDGARGAEFMNAVRDYLQHPITLLE